MKNAIHILCLLASLHICNAGNAQVPKLSSYPSASAVIFLDFDGHTVEGTAWNYNGPIVCQPASLDADKITQIFNRVAEDYRPFNINITTDSAKFLAAPLDKRMRVILTVSSSWYGSAGGVAFVNSFTYGDDTPCFIFTALLNNNVKYIAEAAAHEAGHTLGLYHQAHFDGDCNKLSDYNQGTGSGEIGWAPIMGVGYYRNFTLWNSGPTPYGCEAVQSDLDVITSSDNGFGYRLDDHGSSFASASVTAISNNQFQVQGVIERNTDSDIFRFTVPSTGRFQLDAIPYNVGTGNAGSNLDLQVSLYNDAEQLLNVYNPGTLLSSVIDSTLSAGSYFIKVEGKGNAYAPEYASLGSYSLQGRATPGVVLAVNRLELSGFLNGNLHELRWEIDGDETIFEQQVEISIDNRNFDYLATIQPGAREFSYLPFQPGPAQYRLKLVLADGRQYYSNIVLIKQDEKTLPGLVSTLVQSRMLEVNSPGALSYSIIDLNGRILAKGTLSQGRNLISFQPTSSGIYLIRYTGKNLNRSEKFMIQ